MFLDTVNSNIITSGTKPAPATELPYEAWRNFPHSRILHHGAACCETAREWFLAMDFSQSSGESAFTGPRWIRARYDWGPSAHPIHWCEAVKRKMLDCGALAALARECFLARGVRAFPAQFVQQYSTNATSHWAESWQEEGVSTHWIKDDLIYHEGCAVLAADGTTRLWDASAAWWVNPAQAGGYGSLLAVKVGGVDKLLAGTLRWGTHHIVPDNWTIL